VTRRTAGRIVAVVIVLTTVAIASGCSSTLRDAATVTPTNGDANDSVVHIRRDDFQNEVEALSKSPQVRQQLAQAGIPDKAPASGTADAKLSAFWLTSLIQNVAVQQEFEARGLELSDAERAQAASALPDLGDVPKSLQDKIVENQAMQEKLVTEIGASVKDPVPPTDEQLRAFYDQNSAALTACASGKEVSHILVGDAATANALAQQLAAGANFADLARANSTDSQSAVSGGSLGCLDAQQLDPTFQQAADSAPLNQVVGPVQTQFGYHLILVTPWNPSFEKLREQLAQQATSQAQQQVQQQRSQLYGQAITKRLDAMKVKVDPRYGRWDAKGQYQVVPPTAPTPREHREPTTTTTPVVPGVTGG
jgi:parvulin-like peptidyl-prolyl isomerase